MKEKLFILSVIFVLLISACTDVTDTPYPPPGEISFSSPPGEVIENPPVEKQVANITDENHDNIDILPRVPPDVWGPWAESPIEFYVPTNGLVQYVELEAEIGYWTKGASAEEPWLEDVPAEKQGYASDIKVYLGTSDGSTATVFDDDGHYTGCDGGADDDPECDWDISIRGRKYPQFEGQLLNQTWYLIARTNSAYTVGTIWWWRLTIYYITGSEIEVKPQKLVYYIKPDNLESQAQKIFTTQWQALSTDIQNEGETRVIVTTKPGVFQAFDASDNIDIKQPLETGFAATVNAEGLRELQQSGAVLHVAKDPVMHTTLKQSIPLINADDVHAMGITGGGVAVAVLDTGVKPNYWSLKDDLIAMKCFGSCPNGDNSTDGDGHGTAVSEIITGRGGDGVQPGIAPDANLVAVKVLGDDGSGYLSDIQAGVEWATKNASMYRIKAINMSLGGSPYARTTCDLSFPGFAAAITNAKNKGIATFVASGNEFQIDLVATPACFSDAIAVGAVFDANGYDASYCGGLAVQDKVICYSNANSVKPEVLAPSGKITTTDYAAFAGTSAASPHAAAVGALMFSANPYWSVDFVKDQLMATGKPIVDYRNGRTYPRIDALAAIEQIGLFIKNVGPEPLLINNIYHRENSCWLDYEVEIPLTLGALEQIFIPVGIDRCVGDGIYTDTFVIVSNDEENPEEEVPVELRVEGFGVTPTPTSEVTPTDTLEPTATDEPGVTPSPTEEPPVITPTPTEEPPEVPPWCIPLGAALPALGFLCKVRS